MTLGSIMLHLEPAALAFAGGEPGDPPAGVHAGPDLPARALLRIGADTLRTGALPTFAFSPDSKIIAAPDTWQRGAPEISFFEIPGGLRIRRIHAADPPPAFVQSLAFSADGTRLLWGESGGHVALWDLTGNRVLLRAKLHRDGVKAVAFSADGTLMATGGDDGAVHLRQVATADQVMRDFDVGEQRTSPSPFDPAGVRCLAFTPDGTRLIAGAGHSGAIQIWQIATGQLLRRIDGPPGTPHPENRLLTNRPRLDRIVVTPDGLRLITTGQRLARNPRVFDPRTRQMWVADVRKCDLETGECVNLINGGEEPYKGQAAVTRDGKLVVLTGSSTLRLFDAATDKLVWTIELPGRSLIGTLFSPDGAILATWYDGGIALFDVQSGQALSHDDQTPAGDPLSAAWSPSGDQIVTGHSDGEVRLWDARTGKLAWHRLLAPVLHPLGNTASPSFVAFSSDGRQILVGGSGRDGIAPNEDTHLPGILARYATSGDLLKSDFYSRTIEYGLSSDGKILVVAPSQPGMGPSPNSAVLRGIEVPTGTTLWTSQPGMRPLALGPLASREVYAMAFQPGSTELDVALGTGEVVRLDALTGHEQKRFVADWRSPEEQHDDRSPWPWTWNAVFSGDHKTLVTVDKDKVHVWNLQSGLLHLSFQRGGEISCKLALSPDGKTLAIADGPPNQGIWGKDTIRLFDTETGQQALTLEPGGDRAAVLAFSPDGSRLFSAFPSLAAIVWDVRRKSTEPAKAR